MAEDVGAASWRRARPERRLLLVDVATGLLGVVLCVLGLELARAAGVQAPTDATERIGAVVGTVLVALPLCVRRLLPGHALLAPEVTRRVVERFSAPSGAAFRPELVAGLIVRERGVLRLLARGLSNAEVADELVLDEATVKTHVSRVLRGLGVRDRAQAVVLAYESGLAHREAATRTRTVVPADARGP